MPKPRNDAGWCFRLVASRFLGLEAPRSGSRLKHQFEWKKVVMDCFQSGQAWRKRNLHEAIHQSRLQRLCVSELTIGRVFSSRGEATVGAAVCSRLERRGESSPFSENSRISFDGCLDLLGRLADGQGDKMGLCHFAGQAHSSILYHSNVKNKQNINGNDDRNIGICDGTEIRNGSMRKADECPEMDCH